MEVAANRTTLASFLNSFSGNDLARRRIAAYPLRPKTYGTEGAKPVRRLYGHCRTADFGPIALKTVRQSLIDRALSRIHINHQTHRIRRVFKWGVENELVPADVLISLEAVESLKRGRTAALETTPVRPVPDAYVDALESKVCDQVWAKCGP